MPGKSGTSTRQNGKPRTAPTPDANFIPPTVGPAFQRELDILVQDLSEELGFKGKYLKESYLSKYNDPKGTTPEQRKANAIAKWRSTELRNRTTNQRLLLGGADFGFATSDQVIRKARSIIADTLGPLVTEDILLGQTGHTNGASTRIKRSPSASIKKHTGEAHVSSSALNYWLEFCRETRLNDQSTKLQEHSVLFTVPKATDIDRVACKEPEVNMFLQRSVGNHIRRSLRRKGINLNDQSINQRLAESALADGSATIDLSSASDSITEQLVVELFDPDWWTLLNDIRVKTVEVDGDIHALEMFSSMGNGFTFELESLIFWALTRSIMYYSRVRGKLSVYGDDIIAPKAIAPRLARIFLWFGFIVNPKKSNWTGVFRESCGKHYHRSRDVSPFFLREPVRGKTDIIRILNRLLEWDGRGWGFLITASVYSFHKKWSQIIPRSLHGGQDPSDQTSLVTGTKPASRLVARKRPIEFPQSAALDCWFTKKESMPESALAFDVFEEGPFKIVPQPEYTVRTTWDPYFLDLHSVWLDSSNRIEFLA